MLLVFALLVSIISVAQRDKLHFLSGKYEWALRAANQKMLAPGNNTTYGYELFELDNATGAVSGSNAYNKIPDEYASGLDQAIGVNTANYLYYIGANENYNAYNIYSANTTGGYQPGTNRLVAANLGTYTSDGAAMAVDRSDKAWFITNTGEEDADYNIIGFSAQAYSFQTNGSGDLADFASNGKIQAGDLPYTTIQDICFDNNDNMYLLVANGSPYVGYSYATPPDEVTYYIYRLTAAQIADLAAGSDVTMQRLWQITRADGTPITGSINGTPQNPTYPAGQSVLGGLAITATGRLLVSAAESPDENTFAQYVWELAPGGNNTVISNTSTTDVQTTGAGDQWGFYASDLATNIFDVALPVKFGKIAGRFLRNRLELNWVSETETGNDYFEVQVSRNGTDFRAIGDRVRSKAPDGTSGAALNYDFIYEMKEQPDVAGWYFWGSGLFMLLLALSFCLQPQKRRGNLFLPGMVILLATIGISCQKKADSELEQNSGNRYYIRIAQVDKDGKKAFSKVISIQKESE